MRRSLVPTVSAAVLVAAYIPVMVPVAAADVPTCLGMPATIVGTNGSDDLFGTDGPDVIWAGPSVDWVRGYGGDDLICMGDPADAPDPSNNELVGGGRGDDKIVGAPGAALLLGGEGNDEIWAVGGRDSGSGDDYESIVRGGPGDDVLHGRDGRDSVEGRRGNDTLDGGGGDDLLQGGHGDDALAGGDGEDQLWGDPPKRGFGQGREGDDILRGGAGDDELYGQGGVNDNDGGAGNDGCADPFAGAHADGCERVLTAPPQSDD